MSSSLISNLRSPSPGEKSLIIPMTAAASATTTTASSTTSNSGSNPIVSPDGADPLPPPCQQQPMLSQGDQVIYKMHTTGQADEVYGPQSMLSQEMIQEKNEEDNEVVEEEHRHRRHRRDVLPSFSQESTLSSSSSTSSSQQRQRHQQPMLSQTVEDNDNEEDHNSVIMGCGSSVGVGLSQETIQTFRSDDYDDNDHDNDDAASDENIAIAADDDTATANDGDNNNNESTCCSQLDENLILSQEESVSSLSMARRVGLLSQLTQDSDMDGGDNVNDDDGHMDKSKDNDDRRRRPYNYCILDETLPFSPARRNYNDRRHLDEMEDNDHLGRSSETPHTPLSLKFPGKAISDTPVRKSEQFGSLLNAVAMITEEELSSSQSTTTVGGGSGNGSGDNGNPSDGANARSRNRKRKPSAKQLLLDDETPSLSSNNQGEKKDFVINLTRQPSSKKQNIVGTTMEDPMNNGWMQPGQHTTTTEQQPFGVTHPSIFKDTTSLPANLTSTATTGQTKKPTTQQKKKKTKTKVVRRNSSRKESVAKDTQGRRNSSSSSNSTTTAAVLPPTRKELADAQAAQDQIIAERAAALAIRTIMDSVFAKKLLLSMALVRENPRNVPEVDPGPGYEVPDKFVWSHHPSLEKILKDHMAEYYELSSNSCQSAHQQAFNNSMVTVVRDEVKRLGWTLAPCFNDKTLRDRIRCYYKTHIQNAKKRLRTMISNPTKRANAKHLVAHLALIEGTSTGSTVSALSPSASDISKNREVPAHTPNVGQFNPARLSSQQVVEVRGDKPPMFNGGMGELSTVNNSYNKQYLSPPPPSLLATSTASHTTVPIVTVNKLPYEAPADVIAKVDKVMPPVFSPNRPSKPSARVSI